MSWARGRAAQPSLRRGLLLWLLAPLLLLIPLTAALIYMLAMRPVLEGLDRAMTDTVLALAQIVEERDGHISLPLSDQTARALRANPLDRTYFAVGDSSGRLLGGHAALLALAPPLSSGQWHYFDAVLEGEAVRVAAHGVVCGTSPSQRCPILVAETLGTRLAAERAVVLAALLGAGGLALPMILLALFAVNRGMGPLHQAAQEVGSRTADRLEPIDAATMPREVVAFVQALNELFSRLRGAAAAQRAFVADAAHQLRTPLAVLRVEAAQAMQAEAPAALKPVLQRLHAAAERGARLAQQLLALARAGETALDPAWRPQPIELSRVATEAADRWLQASIAAGQDLGFELAPAWVEGDRMLLEELLGNLLHNAIAHAGAHSRITVRTRVNGGHAELSVQDDGRGIEADERRALGQRFRRGRGAQGTGSGLGLAIVGDIARLHGATLAIDSDGPGRGFCVRVSFPIGDAASGRTRADAPGERPTR